MNLGACYLVGTPVAAVLAFVLHLRARSCVQASLLALRTIFTNWKEHPNPERIFEGNSHSGLVTQLDFVIYKATKFYLRDRQHF